jgi:hypothetical protein
MMYVSVQQPDKPDSHQFHTLISIISPAFSFMSSGPWRWFIRFIPSTALKTPGATPWQNVHPRKYRIIGADPSVHI